jgi:hypothetical protein
MKAIRTRYHGPSNVKGSRISATDGELNRRPRTIYLSYDDALNSEDMHRKAAYAFRDKMQWKGELIGGGFQNDMYWVFQ